MKIQNNNITYPKFTGGVQTVRAGEKAVKACISEAKKPTFVDKYIFRGYTFALGLRTKVTQAEINKLWKFEGDEFFSEAYEFLTKKLGISEKLKPQVFYQPQNPYSNMAYYFHKNFVTRNPEFTDKSKSFIFGQIRHELQHFKQNMDILRHETLGKKAVDVYSDIAVKEDVAAIESRVKNLSKEKIKGLGFDEGVTNDYLALKEMVDNNEIEKYTETMKNITAGIKENYRNYWENLRQTAVEEMGSLKEGTREANRAEKFFNEFTSAGYWQEDGNVHMGQYLSKATEVEALTAEDQIKAEVEGKKYCYFADVKKSIFEADDKVAKVAKGEDQNLTQQEKKQYGEIIETQKKKAEKYSGREEYLRAMAKYLFD